MPKENLNDIYTTWSQNPDKDSEARLLNALTPTIENALTSFAGGDKSLRTRAYILAKESLGNYDPKRSSVNTHVYNNLKRLYRYKAERDRVVHVPENVRLDTIAVNTFITDFKDRYNREPSVIEAADTLKMSKKRIEKAMYGGGESSSTKATSEKGDSFGATQGKTEEQIWSDYVYHDLDNTNRKVFEWTSGYNDRPVLKKNEIADKLKISPAAVSQRINTIQKKLDQLNATPV
jgi:DNA-directed RNA polymerase specialized sigma subunit